MTTLPILTSIPNPISSPFPNTASITSGGRYRLIYSPPLIPIHHPGLRLILASLHLSVVADSLYTHAAEYRAWSVTGLGLQCAKRYTKCNCSRCHWEGIRNRSNSYLMFVNKPQIPKQGKNARQQAVGVHVRYVHPSARPSVKTGSLAISDGVSLFARLIDVVYLCAFAFAFACSASIIDFAPVLWYVVSMAARSPRTWRQCCCMRGRRLRPCGA